MSADRARVRELFFAAVELDEAALDSYLSAECGGDSEMEAEVRSLLGHHHTRSLLMGAAGFDPLSGTRPGLSGPSERYRPLGELGAGGFGRVVKCFDRSLRRNVASKELNSDASHLKGHLLHEARLLAYLDHPGVVQVYNMHGGDVSAYTMKLLQGESLHERLAHLEGQGQLLPVSETVRIVTRISETMANAHGKGVMHLDLKPANIMLEAYGQVSVIDWGISRFFETQRYTSFLESAGEDVSGPVDEGTLSAGTPAYMPAEQFGSGERPVGPTADIFAVGTMLFEMLTGEVPWAGVRGVFMLAYSKSKEPPASIAALRPDVSERLAALCLRMLGPRPEDRPQSFDEVLSELASLADFGDELPAVSLEDGEVLFREGDQGSSAYQILSGVLEVRVGSGDGVQVLARRGTGALIGELAILSSRPRTATLVAIGPARVRPIDPEGLEAELRKVNPLVGQLLRSLSDKLVETMD